MQGIENVEQFQKDVFELLDDVEDLKELHSKEGRVTSIDLGVKQGYCPKHEKEVEESKLENKDAEAPEVNQEKSSVRSSARIKIFQNDFDFEVNDYINGSFQNRNFVNIKEVVTLLESYTSEPVEIITFSNSTGPLTLAEQVKLFNSFDILVSPSGDHLVYGLFTVDGRSKAVVEVSPYFADTASYHNYLEELKFADYILSTGHTTPIGTSSSCPLRSEADFETRNCTVAREQKSPAKAKQQVLVCPQDTPLTATAVMKCDITVNLAFLKVHLDSLFADSLCREPKTVLEEATAEAVEGVSVLAQY